MNNSSGFALDAYLNRIQACPELVRGNEPSSELLTYLMHCHALHIPFEVLDSYLGRDVSLQLGDVVDKMVYAGRGGYCFEHNTLFLAALQSLNVEVWRCLSGRVVYNGVDNFCGRTHMVLIVQLPGTEKDVELGLLTPEELEKKTKKVKWMVDVGFGGDALPLTPLRLETDVPQDTPTVPVRVRPHYTEEGWLHYYVEAQFPLPKDFQNASSTLSIPKVGVPETETSNPLSTGFAVEGNHYWRTTYHFDLQPQYTRDYYMMNFLIKNQSVFTENLVLEGIQGKFVEADGANRSSPFPKLVLTGVNGINNTQVNIRSLESGTKQKRVCQNVEEVYDAITKNIAINLNPTGKYAKYQVTKDDFMRLLTHKLFKH